ncbi:hypothetical protein [Pectobacterium phage PcCB7V]|nr:hypothetical protein [Pectobacterium phage PcCB7V]
MTLFEEYAMLVSKGNADLHKDIYGNYDDPQVLMLLGEFQRKVKANLFSVFDETAPEGLPDVCYKVADWWDGRKLQRRIVCAANRFQLKDGGVLIIPGSRHYSKDMALVLDQLRDKVVSDHVTGDDQGFIDQWGEYHTREEAVIIAKHAGQVNTVRKKTDPADELFSEDLY